MSDHVKLALGIEDGAEAPPERRIEVSVGAERLRAEVVRVPHELLVTVLASHQEAAETERRLATRAWLRDRSGVVSGLTLRVENDALVVEPGIAVTPSGDVIEVAGRHEFRLARLPRPRACVVLEVDDRRVAPFVTAPDGGSRAVAIERVASVRVVRADPPSSDRLVRLGTLAIEWQEGAFQAVVSVAGRDQVAPGPADLSRLELDIETLERAADEHFDRLNSSTSEVLAALERVQDLQGQVAALSLELTGLEDLVAERNSAAKRLVAEPANAPTEAIAPDLAMSSSDQLAAASSSPTVSAEAATDEAPERLRQARASLRLHRRMRLGR